MATPRTEASGYLAKAEQFLQESREALGASRADAAMLNAIHAAISATDAATIALGGQRSSDPDHQRAADLLDEVGGGAGTAHRRSRQLRMLLAKKNVVEYESRRATSQEAREAVERATRLVAWAGEVVAAARL